MSVFEAIRHPDEDRYHIDLFIKPYYATLRLIFVECMGMGEAVEMAEALNEQIASVSLQLLSVAGRADQEHWREDVN